MLSIIDVDCYINAVAWEKDNFEDGKAEMENYLNHLSNEVYAKDWIAVLGSPWNFRDELMLCNDGYKQSKTRVKSREKRPDWFQDLKLYLSEKSNVVWSGNFESDDVIAQWATELREAGEDYCIISTDKDMITIPGKLYSPAVKKYFKTEWFFKEISPYESFHFFCQQLVMGDSVDDIPGLPRYGPVKALRLLPSGMDAATMKGVVINEYQAVYGDNWKEYLLSNGKLLHLVRRPDEWFSMNLFERLEAEASA